MTGAARRFCNDIGSPITMGKIYKIYMQPIVDYGSIAWNQNRIVTNNLITLSIKRVTRYALNISQFTPPSRYICFGKRCELLDIDLPEPRRRALAAIFSLKLLKGETKSTNREIIEPFVRQREAASRTNNLFYTFHTILTRSPAYRILDSMKYYQRTLHLNVTTIPNRKNIKMINKNERTITADNMQSRYR